MRGCLVSHPLLSNATLVVTRRITFMAFMTFMVFMFQAFGTITPARTD